MSFNKETLNIIKSIIDNLVISMLLASLTIILLKILKKIDKYKYNEKQFVYIKSDQGKFCKNIFSILFVYFFSLNIYKMHNQHWTAMLDQDIKIIYNSLLVSSGFEQEYRDHPAYTTFLILGGIFKICSIFFDNFTIQEVF